MVGQFAMKARWYVYISPHKRQRLLHWSPFFSSKVAKRLMCIRHRLLLHLFFPSKGNEMPSKKCNILKSAGHHIFYEWPPNALLHKQLNLWLFHRKYCTIKDGAQTYDFIADKSCLLFSIILKVLSGWEVVRTREKCIKTYIRIFEKILWLNKTSLVRRVTFEVFLIVHMRL